MVFFNALQLVGLFAASPFIITFVRGGDFYAHLVLFWVLLAAYIVGFGAMVVTVAGELSRD